MVASRSRKSWGGANATRGNATGIAPCSRNAASSDALCSAARVTTTRFPASALAAASTTRTLHLVQNIPRTAIREQLRHALAQLCRLFRRGRRALANVLRTVHRTHYGFHHQFTALESRPGPQRDPAATLQRREQRAFRDDARAGFRGVQLSYDFRSFPIFRA